MNKQEHLLTCLAEECAEVQKAVTKSLRFGLDDRHPERNTTNEEEILVEYHHIIGVMNLLIQEGIVGYVNKTDANAIILQKQENVRKYMEYSRESGALEDGVKS